MALLEPICGRAVFLIAPFFLIYITNKFLKLTIVINCVVVILILILIDRPWGSLGWAFAFDGMLYGIIISSLGLKENQYLKKLSIYNNFLIPLLIFLLIFSVDNDLRIHNLHILGYKGISLLSFVSFLLVIIILNTDHKFFNIKYISSYISYIGTRTYSIYLSHLPIFYFYSFLFKELDSIHLRIIVLIICFITTFVVSEYLYRFIENPMRIKGKKFSLY